MNKHNDTGWLEYGEGKDYDDDGLQTYFKRTILKVRFWDNEKGHAFYDVILEGD